MQEEKSPDVKLSHFLQRIPVLGEIHWDWEPVKSFLELLGFSLKNPCTLRREISCLWLKKDWQVHQTSWLKLADRWGLLTLLPS